MTIKENEIAALKKKRLYMHIALALLLIALAVCMKSPSWTTFEVINTICRLSSFFLGLVAFMCFNELGSIKETLKDLEGKTK
jgi:hypothetical protein